ncbi:hypothetical protein [Anabaena azotica]|uniref:Uncharacterized protein n=1 Tax=Anabaena azotica FACHB-119 TaxID=947527 RepID=A0ABR8D911_9NOST|nr:hypothetical protein [Anabaena azotica]MBD2503412.1 hypothetical protein [Anabaena azotica FACHB-119]
MGKGGITSTTWTSGSTWEHGDTTTIRVPVALKADVMAYARAKDKGEALLHGNSKEIILGAIAAYTELRKRDRHPNQHNKELDTNARTWDELRKFAKLLAEQPHLLGLE